MMFDRKQLKSQSREAMRAARPAPFWIALLLAVISLALGVLSLRLTGALDAYIAMTRSVLAGTPTYVEPAGANGFFPWLLNLSLEVMSLELGVGFVIYCLRVWRREKAGAGDLFDSFGVFFRAIWIQLVPSLLVSLWSMTYVLPAAMLTVLTGHAWWAFVCLPLLLPSIAASYSYRQAVYIMLDNPNLNSWQCLALSKAAMRGKRWELFKLDMSFLGWYLLCLFLPVAGLLVMVWVSAYTGVVYAGYYEARLAAFMAENAPPIRPQTPPAP